MALWPLTFEILITFSLSAFLLFRYGNWVTHNVITTLSVFVAWFFSFIVIFILPLDVSTTAFHQCQYDWNETHVHSLNSTNFLYLSTELPSLSNITNGTEVNVTTASPIITTPSPHPSNETDPCIQPWSYVPGNVLPTLWRIVYWTGQALTWLVLPIMQSYSVAGDFTTFGKLKSAILENLIYYGSFAFIFILLLIYVAAHHAISMEYLKVICITASNTWGLILLVVLLGYGLVEIPKSCFDTSKYSRTLSYLYFKVAKLSAEKIESEEKLEDSLDEIHHAYNSAVSNNDRIKPYMAVIIEKCPVEWKAKLFSQNESGAPSNRGLNQIDHVYSESTCVRLHQNIINSLTAHHRTQIQFDHLIRKVIDWEDVAKNQSNPSRIFKPTLPRHLHSYGTLDSVKNAIFNPKVEWYWKCVIRSPFYKTLGFILTCFTFIVVWSEMTFSITSPKLSIFALLIDVAKEHDSFFFIEFVSICSIAYLCVCAYFTIFKIRVFNFYYLAPHHQTDESSLIFCGMLLCRLTPPLCLNFLGLVHLDSHVTKSLNQVETSFTKIMGHMDVIPIISDGFNIYLPMIMCLFCVATFFQIGTRLLHFIGIEQFMLDDEMTTDLIKDGQNIVKRERAKRLKQVDSSQNRQRWSEITSRNQPDDVRQQPQLQSSQFRGTHNDRTELLNDVEPIGYSTTGRSEQLFPVSSNTQPPTNLFDDI